MKPKHTHKKGRIPETTLQCIHHLRLALPNATVSVEVEKPGREGLAELAGAADVVFYSRSWAEVNQEPPHPPFVFSSMPVVYFPSACSSPCLVFSPSLEVWSMGVWE